MQFLALFVCFEFRLPHHSNLTPYVFAVPDFDSLSIKILDPVNAVFFNSFRDRCIRFNAPEVVSPYVAYNLLPRLRADSFFVRVAALRWPALVKMERGRMWPFYPDDVDLENERENHKQFLLELGNGTSKSFSSASSLILDRIWSASVPLNLVDVMRDISPFEHADHLLACELIGVARLLQNVADAVERTGFFLSFEFVFDVARI
jgi:hypothetical protein